MEFNVNNLICKKLIDGDDKMYSIGRFSCFEVESDDKAQKGCSSLCKK